MQKKKYFLGATRPIEDIATHQIAPQSMVDEDCNSCYNFCNLDVEIYREDNAVLLIPKCQKCLNKFARYVASLEMCVKQALEKSNNESLHEVIHDLLAEYFIEASEKVCENSANFAENSQENDEVPEENVGNNPNLFGYTDDRGHSKKK